MTNDINAQLLDIISILSRVDATTSALVKGQEQTAREINSIQDTLANVTLRLTVLETLDIRNLRAQHQAEINSLRAQIQELESKVQDLGYHKGTIKAWFNNILQFGTGIGVLYLAYKLGINP